MVTTNTSVRKETVRKHPSALKTGDRIIFSAGMGGDNQVVTVDFVYEESGIVQIHTNESGSPIEVLAHHTVKFA
jgi:hypothetical protein